MTSRFGLGHQRGFGGSFNLIDPDRALLFAANRVSLAQRSFGQLVNALDQACVRDWRGPCPFGFATGLDEFMNRIDCDLHLLVAKHHRTQHHIFG